MKIPSQSFPNAVECKQLWLLYYAVTSMEKAIQSCQMIKTHCADNRHGLFEPLIVAVHTYYARPFGPNHEVGRLSEDLIPNDRLKIHKCLMHLRNSVFSHTDSRPFNETNRPMHDVVLSIRHGIHEFSTNSPLPILDEYYLFADHCNIMKQIFLTHVHDFNKKYSYCYPLIDGDYLMTLDDTPDLFTPYTYPARDTIYYQ